MKRIFKSLLRVNKIINDINGLIILNKPKGFTSNDCLSKIKKYLHPRKLGHTGTLDANATGVLVCLLGSATKCQEYLMKTGSKLYDAELILGVATDTEDISGNIIKKYDGSFENVDLVEIEKTVKSFIGDYEQIPPMYSSKKVGGKKLLNLARKGIVIDRKVCKLKIYDIEVLDMEDYEHDGIRLKKVRIKVECSKGTYIRTLCKDIGERLNMPACMGDLNRLRTYDFSIEDSITLDEIENKSLEKDFSFIKPCYYQENETAVTFGKFETLHLGHQEIINRLVSLAKDHSISSTVLIIGNRDDSKLLSDAQRISKLKYLGVDNILYFTLDYNNKNMSAEDFVREILYKQLKSKYIIVGSDCSFGYKGIGDSMLLKKLCNELEIKLEVIDKLKVENTDTDISSTFINNEFEKGNIDIVNKLLGR